MSTLSESTSRFRPSGGPIDDTDFRIPSDRLNQADYLQGYRRTSNRLRNQSDHLQSHLAKQLQQISQLGISNLQSLQADQQILCRRRGQVGEFRAEQNFAAVTAMQLKNLKQATSQQLVMMRALSSHWTQLRIEIDRQAAIERALMQRKCLLGTTRARAQESRWANLPLELMGRIANSGGSASENSALVKACRLTCTQWYAAINCCQAILRPPKTPFALGFVFPNLRELDLNRCSDLHLSRLDICLPEQLTSLKWSAQGSGDGEMQRISQLAHLQHLRVESPEISDGGIQLFSRLTRLTTLHLPRSDKLTNIALRAIALLPGLQDLEFSGSSLAEMGYLHLVSSTHLTSLKIHKSWCFTDHSAVALGEIRNLQTLHLQLSSARDLTFFRLSHLSNLRELCLCDCARLTNIGAAYLGAFPHLTALELHVPPLTDQIALSFLSLTQLRRLYLQPANHLSPAGFQILGSLKKLTQLKLISTRAVALGERLEFLQGLTDLRALQLHHWIVRPQSLTTALISSNNLKTLDLSLSALSSEEDLSALAPLTQLENLSLGHTHLTNTALVALQKLSNLRSLDISGCGRITRAGLRSLHSLGQLETLDLRSCGFRSRVASKSLDNSSVNILF